MTSDIKNRIADLIGQFAASGDNNMGPNHPEPSWGEPLVGFCRGDDTIFQELKGGVGPFHWTPLEAFQLAHPQSVNAGELAVISWVLPQTTQTKTDNMRSSRYPAERWVRSRMFGQVFNNKLGDRVVSALNDWGCPAVEPPRLPDFASNLEGPYGRASRWSQRHVAHACGLGTFGLCDGLITPIGKAHRLGSVVARFSTPPVQRPYTDRHAYCLYYANGTCGRCISRCPTGALSRNKGHDKVRCATYVDDMRDYATPAFGFDGYGCGFCQTGVPCSSGIPRGITAGAR